MTTSDSSSAHDHGASLAMLLLRVWLGVRAVVAGLEKYAGTRLSQTPLLDSDGNPDPSGATVEVQEKVYGFSHYQAVPDALREKLDAEPLLPAFLTSPFYSILGIVLIAFGVTLLLGVFTRVSLLVLGLVYVALTVGLILLKQDAGVAWLALHVALTAYALHLSKYNRFTLTRS